MTIIRLARQREKAWITHLPEVLWVLFVGAVVTEDNEQDHETWFATQLKIVCQILQCNTSLDFEYYLHCLVWDNMFGVEFLNKWWTSTPDG